jgi:hypothetical protein
VTDLVMRYNQTMTRTAHTFTVTAHTASLPGYTVRCTCGTEITTSLSEREANGIGWKHVDWHDRQRH